MITQEHHASGVRVKLFIEGIEFPLVSGRGTYANSSGAPLVMQFQIVVCGDPRFLGRTYVELNYYDTDEYPNGISVFTGEMTGYQYHSMAGTGTVVMSCVSSQSYQNKMMLNLLSQKAAAYVEDTDEDMKKTPSSVGEMYSSFAGGILVPDYTTVQKALFTKSITQPNADGILGGLVHLMEMFAGIQKGSKRTVPVDNFIGMAEYRLALLQRIVTPDNDKTIQKLMKLGSTKKFVRKLFKGMRGNQPLSFTLLKQMLLNRMHYQSIVSSASMLQPERTESRSYNTYNKGMDGAANASSYAQWMEFLAKELERNSSDRVKFLSWDLAKYASEMATLKVFCVATVPAMSKLYLAGVQTKKELPFVEKNQKLAAQRKRQKSAVDELTSEIKQYGGKAMDNLIALDAVLPYTGAGKHQFLDNNSQRVVDAMKQLKRAAAALRKWGSLLSHGAPSGTGKKQVTLVSRYHEEILVPDLWYAMPPACNVFFEGMYSKIALTRNNQGEPTRLLLMGPKVGFEGVYVKSQGQSLVVAPNLRGEVGKKILEDVLRGKYTILPHEKFMGPQPVVIPITQALGLAEFETGQGSSEDEYFGIGGGAPPDLQKLLDRSPMSRGFPFLQRVAHASYMDQYFGSRRGSMVGPFFPRIIAGLPSAVLVRRKPSDTADTMDLYVAKVVQVDVTISPGGISMNTHLSHVRHESEWVDLSVYLRMYKKDPYADASARWASAKNKLAQAAAKGRLDDAQSQIDTVVALNEIQIVAASKAGVAKTEKERNKQIDLSHKAVEALNAVHAFRADMVQKAQIEAAGTAGDTDGKGAKAIKETNNPVSGDDPAMSLESTQTPKDQALAKVEASLDRHTADFATRAQKVLDLMHGGTSAVSTKAHELSLDELCRPPWLDPIYNDDVIGQNIYSPLWGVESVLDYMLDNDAYSADVQQTLEERGQMGVIRDFTSLFGDSPWNVPERRRSKIATPQEIRKFCPNAFNPLDEAQLNWAEGKRGGETPETSPMTDTSGDIDPRPHRLSRVWTAAQRLIADTPRTNYEILFDIDDLTDDSED